MTITGINSLFTAAKETLGVRADPMMAYNFLVEVGGLFVGGFSEVKGLGSEVDLESYHEGGQNRYVHQLPTVVKHSNLVLRRGLTYADPLWGWYWLTTQGHPLLLNGSIVVLNDQGLPVTWWNFREAYPVKWTGPEFNAAEANQIAVEEFELVHRGLQRVPASVL
ncbi:phage tail protein [Pseudanabaenaceae cyanobacterium LEGE 13415]|nr:phage tail protein [Pseudanabaenaceae cyanobacterium LEGE 13415]